MIAMMGSLVMGALQARYEALEGGRPKSAAHIRSRAAFTQLIRRTAHPASDPARIWLDLANGESLVVGFEPCAGEEGCCTMRVRQTRVAGECSLDNPAGCTDAGCVAVRWDLRNNEGVLLDLFKAKAGARLGCDISSADDGGVKWGRLMMRVVDDVAALVGVRAVYVADESSQTLQVWDDESEEGKPVQVRLQPLQPRC